MGDSDRLRGLVTYLGPDRLASVSPGRGSRLPLPINDGYGAIVERLELLATNFYAA